MSSTGSLHSSKWLAHGCTVEILHGFAGIHAHTCNYSVSRITSSFHSLLSKSPCISLTHCPDKPPPSRSVACSAHPGNACLLLQKDCRRTRLVTGYHFAWHNLLELLQSEGNANIFSWASPPEWWLFPRFGPYCVAFVQGIAFPFGQMTKLTEEVFSNKSRADCEADVTMICILRNSETACMNESVLSSIRHIPLHIYEQSLDLSCIFRSSPDQQFPQKICLGKRTQHLTHFLSRL